MQQSLNVNRTLHEHVTEYASPLGGHKHHHFYDFSDCRGRLPSPFVMLKKFSGLSFFSYPTPSNKSLVSRKELNSLAFFTVNVSAQIVLIGGRFPLSAGHVFLGDAESQRCRPGSWRDKESYVFFLSFFSSRKKR